MQVLLTFIQGLLQDLIKKFKEFIFSSIRVIVTYYIFCSHANKAILVSANNILAPCISESNKSVTLQAHSNYILITLVVLLAKEGAEEYTWGTPLKPR